MKFIYDDKKIEFTKVEKWGSKLIYCFEHEKEIILLHQFEGKWRLNWGGSSKKSGNNYEWFGKTDKDRFAEGEKFARYLFEMSPLRLYFLLQDKS